MGELQGHLFIITICVFSLWVAFGSLIWWGFRYIIKGSAKERAAKREAARIAADRRG